MRVFFPRYLIESHREPWQSAKLVCELAKLDVHCLLEMDRSIDVVFCGGISVVEDAANGFKKDPYGRLVPGYRDFPKVPVVHYCWDLYPWVVTNKDYPDHRRWVHYMRELRRAKEVWVPTTPVVKRVEQFLKRDAHVVKCPVPFWDPDEPARDGGYVVDVMRRYPKEPNVGLVTKVCAELGIPHAETGASLSWDDYRRTIANARLLVSSYYEASTGSLALLEGYRLGKPVLLSDSPWHGGRDLFGDRATYFRWDDEQEFAATLNIVYQAGVTAPEDSAYWAEATYGETAFAHRMAERLREVVGGR